jgi:predicted hydrocarbon binding protein
MSPTYCLCSRGFVQKYWEGIVGRSLKVDLLGSCLSGAQECKFAIHL